MTRSLIGAAAFLLLLGSAGAARAGGKADPKKGAAPVPKETVKVTDVLPFASLFSPEEIRSGFDRQRITPLGNDRLYFEILIPKDWDSRPLTVTKQQITNDDTELVPMAELTPTKGPENVLVEVRYMRVPPQVALDTFVDSYVKAAKFVLVTRQKGDFNGRTVEDALLRMDTKEYGAILTRLTASRRGEYIFVVASSAPEKLYPKFKNVFGAAAVSFDPAGK
jgi:hypothetical protein